MTMGLFKEILKGIDKIALGLNNTEATGARDRSFEQRELVPAQNRTRRYQLPYWEHHWKRNGDDFVGCYVTRYGRWEGYIRREYEGKYTFFITNPPSLLKKSSHWRCFMHQGGEVYLIHFERNPKDITNGIISIESFIRKEFEKHGR